LLFFFLKALSESVETFYVFHSKNGGLSSADMSHRNYFLSVWSNMWWFGLDKALLCTVMFKHNT